LTTTSRPWVATRITSANPSRAAATVELGRSVSSMLKEWAKRIVPEKYRLARYEWYETLRYYPELLFSLGTRFECPFCGWRFRRFRAAGFEYPVLRQRQVIGASWHPDDVCPRCKSNARERLVYFYLKENTSTFTESLRLLHIAPEPHLERILRQLPNILYVSADLAARAVDVRLDIMMLPFPDQAFDLVICNHVLEHVIDDRAAMSELHRVLRSDRPALLQVPIARAIDRTIEDPTAVTDADRIRLFGQRDHVRLYAADDYMKRLERAGFCVQLTSAEDCLGAGTVRRYALVREEPLFACRTKPRQLNQAEIGQLRGG
jgi:SAM-dependent methyltransferase